MSSIVNTYPNDKFLQKNYVANVIEKYMQGELIAENEATIRDIGLATSVSWLEEEYSDYSDTNRLSTLDEIRLEQSSLFPHVKFKGLQEKTDVLHKYGIEIDFSEEVMNNKQMVDFITRGLQRAAYWMANLLNELTFNNMTNSWSTTPSTETNDEPWNQAANHVWSDTTYRIPLQDIGEITLKVEDTENYANELDRAYVRKDNFQELLDYLQTTTNVPWAKDPTTGSWNRMVNGIKIIPVHKLSGIPASTALFLSRNVKPTTIYEGTNPQYAQQRLTDNNGKPLPGAYHVHKYFTDADHDTHIQIWRQLQPVTTRWGRKSVGILRTL